ncbi:MAG: glycosyltransferase [Gemmatimonadota bacterium]|nr:glycosyltransferase [Gemmatimonadota bacterium]
MTAPRLDSAAPLLSVVVPSVNTLADVERTLAALEREQASVALEILLVDRLGDSVRTAVRSRHPSVRVIEAPATATIPAMRKQAFQAATGEYVAVIEDHVIVPEGWASSLLAAEKAARSEAGSADAIVGGSVENAATHSTVDWAAFLCEYSHCITPMPSGPSDWVTGNNVIYPRALLQRYMDRLSPDQWENYLHGLMKDDGVTLVLRPEITVGHEKYYTLGEYLSQRYLYARSYAGARVAGASLPKRLAFGAASIALPPVLFARTIQRIFAKKRHRAELIRSIPMIAIFVCAWAWGEVVGSWFGAGDSLQKVC